MSVGYMFSDSGIRLARFGVKAIYGLSTSPVSSVLLSPYSESTISELSVNNLIAFTNGTRNASQPGKVDGSKMTSQAYTIPSSWTAPKSCFASTNYFFVLLGNDFFSNMYGTPTPVLDGNTPTGECFPPSFSINEPYTTDGDCPEGYTRACATGGTKNGEPVSTVTCCPSITDDVFSFMCKDNEYGCHATATKGVIWTGRVTDIGLDEPTDEPTTRTPSTDEGIEAWGIKFIQISSTEATATSTPTSTTEEPLSSDAAATPANTEAFESEDEKPAARLSAGAIAGVAIGSAAGVGLFGGSAFLLWRRRKNKTSMIKTVAAHPEESDKEKYASALPPLQRQFEAAEMWSTPRLRSDQAWELP